MPICGWMPLFKEAAKAVRESIEPFVGTKNAAESLMTRGDGDVTRRIDAVAEETAIEILRKSGQSFRLVSEELGLKDFGTGKRGTIVLDALDGSFNATVGIPAYSFSIAFANGERLGAVSEALVADLHDGTLYEAELDKGAKRNGNMISPSNVKRLSEGTVGVDLNMVDLRTYTKKIMGILNMAKRKRYLGTNALEICLVACGMYDAFIDLRGISRVTDVAAAFLILKEARGVLADEKGLDVDADLLKMPRLSFVACANLDMFKNILANLSRSRID